MGTHLIDGEFQSDKYPTTPRGKVPLSVKDPAAQGLLWEYAQRRRAVDAEFADDLQAALRAVGFFSHETYAGPVNGWTCFHCGETFRTPGAAALHFGATPDSMPGCILKVKAGEEFGLLMALRKAEADVMALRSQNEQLDHEAGSYHGMVRELERYFAGARSAHQAFLRLDEVEGRALAAEAIVKAAEELAPDLIARAREMVCDPPPAITELTADTAAIPRRPAAGISKE
jgi:hypothetical protein